MVPPTKPSPQMPNAPLSAESMANLESIYKDFHRNPELGFHETRTAKIVAKRLLELGFEVTEEVGITGVVGVLQRGEGPTVMLRADMDGLPVKEQTGLPYASEAVFVNDEGKASPVMHACGHDMHTTCLLGACEALANDSSWTGKVLAVFQPNEEQGAGAKAMIADGLFERFGTPEIVLGQHVAPLPAGFLGFHPGPAFAASDALRITIFGEGGHGSRPDTTIDPIVIAASVIMRLQTIVSREIPASEVVVLSVGSIHAGDAPNIIPAEAVLQLSLRTFEPAVREQVLAAIKRIVDSEAAAAGVKRSPEIEHLHSFPAVVNSPEAGEITVAAFQEAMPAVPVIDPGTVTGSEDVGLFARAADAPCVYWLLGGAGAENFVGLKTQEEAIAKVFELPSNHSPLYAPAIEPTMLIGITALKSAALQWLTVE